MVHGIPLSMNDVDKVIVSAGGQQAMAAALRATKAGTNVFLSQWDYAAVSGIIKDNGCNEVRIEVNDDLSIKIDDLEEKLTEESVFYVSMPNNPTGYLSPQDLETVVKLTREKEGGVIWDAPYIFTILKLTPTKAEFNKKFLKEKIEEFKKISSQHYEDMCILSSISKTCLMAGLRFGFATASTYWIRIINTILGRENLSSPTSSLITGTQALQMFLQNPITHEWVCDILAKRLTLLIEEELPLILPKNGAFGALYALVKTNNVDGTKFANKLIDKHGIVTVTGNPFYGGTVNAVRLSLVATPWIEGDLEWAKNVKELKKYLM
jgi:aspartate/methionine/tyrosine aminotransferase